MYKRQLLVTAGSSLFNFVDAQLADKIESVNDTIPVPQNPSLGLLQVSLVNQYGHATWGRAWVVLPNGKELEMYESAEKGRFYIEVPLYCKGKDMVVYAEQLGDKKKKVTVMFQVGEEIQLTFKFKANRRYKHVIGGYF